MHWYQQPEWWSAIGTIVASATALSIAIFGEWLRALFRKPNLEATLELAPPDSHMIELKDRYTGERLFDSYYFRMKINNTGNDPAFNVEVKALELRKEDIKGNFVIDKKFLPINLVWAHTQGMDIFTPIIHQKLFRHCDLCHTVRDSENNLLLMFDTFPVPNKVSPDRYPTIIPPGNYQLKIVVTSTNSEPKYFYFNIDFKGKWFDDEEKMFQGGIVIEVK